MKSKYIAVITSVIAVSVTLFQVYIQHISKTKELELAHLKYESEYRLAKLHEDRSWKYKMTEFMARYKEDIFSKDLETKLNIQKIMMVSFPVNITTQIFSDLAKVSQDKEWLKAIKLLKRIDTPTVYIQIEKGVPDAILEPIADTIAEGDISYFTNDEYIDENLTNGDVRYFLPNDKQLAETVLKDFVDMACEEGYKLDLQLIPLIQNKDRNIQGTIEVWLSAKSIQKITNPKDDCFYEEPKI